MKKGIIVIFATIISIMCSGQTRTHDSAGGWVKYEGNPILGGDLGTIFDVSIMKDANGKYMMYNSWRTQKSIALSYSDDGFKWNSPVICFPFNNETGWEYDVNRPVVIEKDGVYHMWYTGQVGAGVADGYSWIGHVTSKDGKLWTRDSDKPVISAELPWEKVAVMSPHVIWDEDAQLFKMWYCGGEQIEPNAIGYATSKDGVNWEKHPDNPIFQCDENNEWEQNRVGGCMIIKRENDYLMFYIGYKDMYFAQIGMARSKDGITNWERYENNPIIFPGTGWDMHATYKPYPIRDEENNRWLLYYNGRAFDHEQMGMAVHEGLDLGF